MDEGTRHERAVEFIKAECGRLQQRFGLEHMRFRFVFVQAGQIETESSGGYTREFFARVLPDLHNHEILITVATLRPLSEIRSTLRHELVHVLVEPLHSFMYRMIDRLPRSQRLVVSQEWDERLEQAVSDLEIAMR
jgi:hypothetical protein